MELVLTLLAAYVLCGSIWPQLVRQKQFFLMGTVAVAGAMLLDSFSIGLLLFLSRILDTVAFATLVIAATGSRWEEYVNVFKR